MVAVFRELWFKSHKLERRGAAKTNMEGVGEVAECIITTGRHTSQSRVPGRCYNGVSSSPSLVLLLLL